MEFYCIYLPLFAAIMLTSFVSARAVNISNTWMLPEEGFPVFYRYFRDRISWYEADAVCQFHHANLVTADSTSQYDAIRAYLKELDITENIWIGLSKPTNRPNFTWTNFRPLNGDGYWQQPIPKTNEAVCIVMDPVADFLWKPMTCGGPDVASFICELPVPTWAMGPNGCLLTEVPSLTVLYIPEQLALELTSDCGLDGTKRISCKGNADREEILKQLSCAIPPDDFDDKSTKAPVLSTTLLNTIPDVTSDETSSNSKTTKPWIWTSNTLGTDYGMPTRHRRETEDTLSPSSTKSTTDLSTLKSQNMSKLTTTSVNLNYDAIATSFTPEDVTLDLIQSSKSDREIKTTELTESTTQRANEQTEEQFEMGENVFATTESKTFTTEVDTGEYPSAIGQGQLFSIIENGTMFDLIEVNETTSANIKLTKEIMMETPQSESDILKTSTDDHTTDILYTTVVYHKEPPSEANFVTNKSVKKTENKQPKKHIFKVKESKNINQKINLQPKTIINRTEYNATTAPSKEEDLFPIATDSLIKLNRTFRKELPPNESINMLSEAMKFNNNLSSSNHAPDDVHRHIEIKWQEEKNNNLLEMKLFVTTKRSDSVKTQSQTKENLELVNGTEDESETFHKIDSKIDFLNINNTAIENNNTETFAVPTPEKLKTLSSESNLMKEQFLPKSLLGEVQNKIDPAGVIHPSSESLEPEPQAQPRPNRQRQLTRPQRRSFYPYFFSRVLG